MKYIKTIAIATLLISGVATVSYAQTNPNVPDVRVEDQGFQLAICDGPAGANLDNDPNYRACDFDGVVAQVQYLINVMIVLGVFAAIIGFAYAGYLYITGKEDNIKKAKDIFPKIGIGFILMLTAWFIVFQILEWLTGSTNYLN